jgi:hypothetical protein
MSRAAIEAEVAEQARRLGALNREKLGDLWAQRYAQSTSLGSEPFLRHQLAWRIQAEALGGLDEATLQSLTQSAKVDRGPKLRVGSRLAREWQGARVEVEVVEGGFRYGAQTYASLSQVARIITGVRWNGPRFFGLRVEDKGER